MYRIAFVAGWIFLSLFLAWVLFLAHQYTFLTAAALVAVFVWVLRTAVSDENSARTGVKSIWHLLCAGVGRIPLSVIILLGAILRFMWPAFFDTQPTTDFARFYNDARALAAGSIEVLGVNKSPSTLLFYAPVAWMSQTSTVAVYVVNALAGALQIFLVYRISQHVWSGKAPAAFAALMVALFPSLIYHSSYPSSETVFATILLTMVWVYFRMGQPGRINTGRAAFRYAALLAGLTIALHYARNNGIVVGTWIAIATLLFASCDVRRWNRAALLFAIVCAVLLVPQVIYNKKAYGYYSIQSSKFAALNFYYGTSREHAGMINSKDATFVRITYGFGDDTWATTSRELRRRAWKRINYDRAGYVHFVLFDKTERMWANDHYGVDFSMRRTRFKTPTARENLYSWLLPAARATANYYYYTVFALALLSLMTLRRTHASVRQFLIVTAGLFGTTVLLHAIIEVQPRYHHALVFFVCVLAAGILQPDDDPDRDLV